MTQSKLFTRLQEVTQLEHEYKQGEPIKKQDIRMRDFTPNEFMLFTAVKKGGDFGIISGVYFNFLTYTYTSCNEAITVRLFLEQ